mgnify:CR=1 FL=1
MTASERRALGWAAAAHMVLAAALSLGWSRVATTTPVATVPVELEIGASAPGVVAAAAASPEPLPALPAPAPDPAPAREQAPAPSDPQPQPVLDAVPQSVPEPIPEPVPRSEPEPAVESRPPRPEPRPRPGRQPPPHPQAAAPDARELAAALDRALGRPDPSPVRGRGAISAQSPPGAGTGGGGPSAEVLASLAAAIKAQVTRCWNPPVGQSRPSTVTLRLQLGRDGALARPPDIVGQTGETDPALRRPFDESARRAVLQCAPLQLPPDLYDAWRDVELNFDPRDLA